MAQRCVDLKNKHTSIRMKIINEFITYQDFDDGVHQRLTVLVDQGIELDTNPDLQRQHGDTETDIKAEKIFERDTQDLAVAQDGVGIDVGANIDQGLVTSEMVELAGRNDLCCTSRQLDIPDRESP